MSGNVISEGESCTVHLWEDDVIKPNKIVVVHTSNFRLTKLWKVFGECSQSLPMMHRTSAKDNTGTVKWTEVKCLPLRRPISVWFYFCSEIFLLSEMIVCRLKVFNKSVRDKLAFWFPWKWSGKRISIISDTTVFFFLCVYSAFFQSLQGIVLSAAEQLSRHTISMS